jgi:hypothetical protein
MCRADQAHHGYHANLCSSNSHQFYESRASYTSFSFPSNCLSNLYDFSTYGLDAPWTYETQGCALSTCCPSNNYYTVGWVWFRRYYSPGVCPSDYHSCAPYRFVKSGRRDHHILLPKVLLLKQLYSQGTPLMNRLLATRVQMSKPGTSITPVQVFCQRRPLSQS